MSQRQQRVAERIRHIVAEAMVRDVWHTPTDTSLLVVDDVWVSADLRMTRVFISSLGKPLDEETMTVLNDHITPLRKHLGKELSTKYTPTLELWKS